MNIDIQIGPNVSIHTTRETMKRFLDDRTSAKVETLISSLVKPCNTVSQRVFGVDYVVRVREPSISGSR